MPRRPRSAGRPSPTAAPVVSHDYSPTPRVRRHLHARAALVLGAALLTGAALHDAADQPSAGNPLGGALRDAGQALKQWQAQLARGLQVSMRAVADGREAPPPAPPVRPGSPPSQQARR
jgi:hypothetical protein